jgi:hypothetical protein
VDWIELIQERIRLEDRIYFFICGLSVEAAESSVGCIASSDRMWKEEEEGSVPAHQTLDYSRRSPYRYLNPCPLEYKAGLLHIRPRLSVNTPAFYSRDPGFKYVPGVWIS